MSDLVAANEASVVARQARAKLKQAARTGRVTFSEVLVSQPQLVGPLRLCDVVAWGWPRMGSTRQLKVGQVAAREGLNLLLPASSAAWGTRQRVAQIMGEVRDGKQEAFASVVAESSSDVDRIGRLLARAEKERDEALARCAVVERQVLGCQLTMPTVQAERMLAELADAVEEHKRGLSDGAPDFADADRRLWVAKDEILASGAVLSAVAA